MEINVKYRLEIMVEKLGKGSLVYVKPSIIGVVRMANVCLQITLQGIHVDVTEVFSLTLVDHLV